MKKHPIKRGDESRAIMLKYWEELREHPAFDWARVMEGVRA